MQLKAYTGTPLYNPYCTPQENTPLRKGDLLFNVNKSFLRKEENWFRVVLPLKRNNIPRDITSLE